MRGVTGTVLEIHRYPVKSLSGERLDRVAVEERGLHGDRLWSVRDPDGKFGSGKSSRRFRRMPGLLDLAARYDGDVPVLAFPDGRDVAGDDPGLHTALSAHVGRPVTLGREGRVSHFDDGPVHLVSTSALRTVRDHGHRADARSTRANLLVDTGDAPGFPDDAWVGRRLRLGSTVELQVLYAMPRCVMLDMGQVGLPPDEGLLRTVTALNDGALGVVADVVVPGEVAVGDALRVR